MVDAITYYLEKARQCRRLARATNDERANEGLSAMADEFEAKAKALETAERTIDLLGDGTPGRLVPDQSGETN